MEMVKAMLVESAKRAAQEVLDGRLEGIWEIVQAVSEQSRKLSPRQEKGLTEEEERVLRDTVHGHKLPSWTGALENQLQRCHSDSFNKLAAGWPNLPMDIFL